MEFWLIMIGFIVMGGSCSLAGTWWDRKNKKDKKEEKNNGIIVMYDTGGGVYYDGMWQQSG